MNNKLKLAIILIVACMFLTACNNGEWGATNTNNNGQWETTAQTSLDEPYLTTPSMKKAETILEETYDDGTKYFIRDLKGVAYVEITYKEDNAENNTLGIVNSMLIRSNVLTEYDDVYFYWYDSEGLIALSVIERNDEGYDTSPTYGITWYREDYYNEYMAIDPTALD